MAPRKKQAPPPPTASSHKVVKQNIKYLIKFDDLGRNCNILNNGSETEFLKMVHFAKEMRRKWLLAESERKRIVEAIAEKDIQVKAKDAQIRQARILYDENSRTRHKTDEEIQTLSRQLKLVKDFLGQDNENGGNQETFERIRKMELQNLGSEYSLSSRSKDDLNDQASSESILDVSELSSDEDSRDNLLRPSRVKRQSTFRRSHSLGVGVSYLAERLIATTTVTIGNDGSAYAESILEKQAVPQTLAELNCQRTKSRLSREQKKAEDKIDFSTPKDSSTPTNSKNVSISGPTVPIRSHDFQRKVVVMIEKCQTCGKRTKFGKEVLKCRVCSLVCHVDCKFKVSTQCVDGTSRTPKTAMGTGSYLADFTSLQTPMVPALLENCIKELEARGLNEIGLYRIPGNEAEATELLEKLCVSKGAASKLSKYETHTIASCIKKFLRGLKEPIIPLLMWRKFVDAAANKEQPEEIYNAVVDLPRPNRDTLALLVVHLQNVARNSEVNKMDLLNLGTIMAPTVVGYSSSDPMAFLNESSQQKSVMKAILEIPTDYWSSFLARPNSAKICTPSTGRLRFFKGPDTQCQSEPKAPFTGGPAKRTRSNSRNLYRPYSLFQSPQI